jgi:putative phosphoribosyl transferase
VQALKLRKPGRLILAAPVCAAQTAELFASQVDELLCLASPSDLGAIGLWYRNFDQTTDQEVVQLLEVARKEHGAT